MNEVYKASGLGKWFDEDWKDISRKKKGGGHPACGASADKGARSKDSSKKYPKCVPATKAKRMNKKQKQSAVRRKRNEPNKPGKPDFVKTDVQKESWEKWKPRRDEVYPGGAPSNNAPNNPEAMAGAVAFEKNRKQVLSQLKEVIHELIISVLLENDTVRGKIFRRPQGNRPTETRPPETQLAYKSELERLFKEADEALKEQEEKKGSKKTAPVRYGWGQSSRTEAEDLEAKIVDIFENITNMFVDIMRGQTEQYADLIDDLAGRYPRLNKKIEDWEMREKQGMNVKIWGKMAYSIEAVRGGREMTTMLKTQPEATSSAPRTKTRPAQELNLPTQSPDFIRAVGDYRNMVANTIQEPNQRQIILSRISDIQFDPEIPEQMKLSLILSMMRNVLGTRRPSSSPRRFQNESGLSIKVRNLIILSVLKEQDIYG